MGQRRPLLLKRSGFDQAQRTQRFIHSLTCHSDSRPDVSAADEVQTLPCSLVTHYEMVVMFPHEAFSKRGWDPDFVVVVNHTLLHTEGRFVLGFCQERESRKAFRLIMLAKEDVFQQKVVLRGRKDIRVRNHKERTF